MCDLDEINEEVCTRALASLSLPFSITSGVKRRHVTSPSPSVKRKAKREGDQRTSPSSSSSSAPVLAKSNASTFYSVNSTPFPAPCLSPFSLSFFFLLLFPAELPFFLLRPVQSKSVFLFVIVAVVATAALAVVFV